MKSFRIVKRRDNSSSGIINSSNLDPGTECTTYWTTRSWYSKAGNGEVSKANPLSLCAVGTNGIIDLDKISFILTFTAHTWHNLYIICAIHIYHFQSGIPFQQQFKPRFLAAYICHCQNSCRLLVNREISNHLVVSIPLGY